MHFLSQFLKPLSPSLSLLLLLPLLSTNSSSSSPNSTYGSKQSHYFRRHRKHVNDEKEQKKRRRRRRRHITSNNKQHQLSSWTGNKTGNSELMIHKGWWQKISLDIRNERNKGNYAKKSYNKPKLSKVCVDMRRTCTRSSRWFGKNSETLNPWRQFHPEPKTTNMFPHTHICVSKHAITTTKGARQKELFSIFLY